ncbi:unnamed protein product [Closterium sp. Yama58-4]|nr:unnamed protein product [Closterium sp. Yama58-4]
MQGRITLSPLPLLLQGRTTLHPLPTHWHYSCWINLFSVPCLQPIHGFSQTLVCDVIIKLFYNTASRRMSMWPAEEYIEAAFVECMRMCDEETRIRVHIVLANDTQRSGFLSSKMAKVRAGMMDQARAWIFIWFGLPFTLPRSSRAQVPPVQGEATEFEDFLKQYPKGAESFDLHTWIRAPEAGGLPFAHPAFESGIAMSLFKGKPEPVVVKLYHIAYFLMGLEHRIVNKGKDLEHSAAINGRLTAEYLRKVTAWCKAAIMAPAVNGSGPWYNATEKAWAFSRSKKILISTDGIEDTEGIDLNNATRIFVMGWITWLRNIRQPIPMAVARHCGLLCRHPHTRHAWYIGSPLRSVRIGLSFAVMLAEQSLSYESRRRGWIRPKTLMSYPLRGRSIINRFFQGRSYSLRLGPRPRRNPYAFESTNPPAACVARSNTTVFALGYGGPQCTSPCCRRKHGMSPLCRTKNGAIPRIAWLKVAFPICWRVALLWLFDSGDLPALATSIHIVA